MHVLDLGLRGLQQLVVLLPLVESLDELGVVAQRLRLDTEVLVQLFELLEGRRLLPGGQSIQVLLEGVDPVGHVRSQLGLDLLGLHGDDAHRLVFNVLVDVALPVFQLVDLLLQLLEGILDLLELDVVVVLHVLVDRAAHLVVLADQHLGVIEVLTHLVHDDRLHLLELEGVLDNEAHVGEVVGAYDLDGLVEPSVLVDPLSGLGHFDHLVQDHLERVGDVVAVRGEVQGVLSEHHFGIEEPEPRFPVFILDLVPESDHAQVRGLHQDPDRHVIGETDEGPDPSFVIFGQVQKVLPLFFLEPDLVHRLLLDLFNEPGVLYIILIVHLRPVQYFLNDLL